MSVKAHIYGSFLYEGPSIDLIISDCVSQFPWLSLAKPAVVQRDNVYHVYGQVL